VVHAGRGEAAPAAVHAAAAGGVRGEHDHAVGRTAGGKYGLGMLCVAATQADGFDALGTNWKIANEIAAEHGNTMDPAGLRLVGPMHLAETREQARANVQYGLKKWLDYFSNVNPTAPLTKGDKDPVDELIETGRAIIGTPEDAIAQIERLLKQQGEFGAFLQLAHNWANFENTKKSYELFAGTSRRASAGRTATGPRVTSGRTITPES
jgi:limonene 1,2-monooxygenase